MPDLASRLKDSRLRAGKSQTDVAEAVGIKQPTYQSIESGKTKKSAFIPMIAQYLGVDPLWLATGESDSSFSKNDIYDPVIPDDGDEQFIWIDVVEATFSCGTGEDIEFHFDTINGKIPFTPSYFKSKGIDEKGVKIIKAKGDSMAEFINDGDLVGIDMYDTNIMDGGIYAVYFAGEGVIKQIFKEADGSLILHSLNEKYRDRVVTEENGSNFKVMGRQFWRAG